VSQEPADPTASSAPPDGTLPTIPSAGADVQPERVADEATGGDATIEAQAATPVGPPAEPAGTSGATSAAILAAVTAADTETAETAAATEPLASAEPAPAAETAETGSAAEPPAAAAVEPADAGPSRRGPWRPIAGILALVLLAAALGFAGAFLVPVLVDVPVPNGAVATTPAVSPTPAPTATVTATPSPSRSPQPTGSPPASPTPQSSSTIYIVQRGDILSAIANRFGVTVQAIVAANGLKDPNHIEPGQRLIIPPP
jgi:LysM repeat protein